MNRRGLLAGAAAVTIVLARGAPGQARPWRIGFLHPGEAAYVETRVSAFRKGFAAAGASVGVDVVVRVADNRFERLPALAVDLVGAGIQALCPVSPPAVTAARQATHLLPTVALDLEADPVSSGWVKSLARPGDNLTGIFLDFPDFTAKCLQTLREAVPTLRSVAVLWHPFVGTLQLDAARNVASRMGLAVGVYQVGGLDEIGPAFAAMQQAGAEGLLMLSSPLFGGNLALLAELAARHRMPAINQFPEFAQHGGLLGYGPELQGMFGQMGALTRKVLEAGPGVPLPPVERPDRFRLVINGRSAAALGLSVAPLLLARADEVIE